MIWQPFLGSRQLSIRRRLPVGCSLAVLPALAIRWRRLAAAGWPAIHPSAADTARRWPPAVAVCPSLATSRPSAADGWPTVHRWPPTGCPLADDGQLSVHRPLAVRPLAAAVHLLADTDRPAVNGRWTSIHWPPAVRPSVAYGQTVFMHCPLVVEQIWSAHRQQAAARQKICMHHSRVPAVACM